MFDPESRYHDLPERRYSDEEGRETVFKARRLLKRPSEPPKFREEVSPADRPDLLAHRTLHDPLRFWRLCDANAVMDPFELTRPGRRRVRVPSPGE